MKLRLDPGKISFRLDFDELEQLLARGEIQESIPLPTGHLTYGIICLPTGSPPKFQTADGAYILSLAKSQLENHKATLPSLKGIITEFDHNVTVALEVNLKKKLKHSLSK